MKEILEKVDWSKQGGANLDCNNLPISKHTFIENNTINKNKAIETIAIQNGKIKFSIFGHRPQIDIHY